MLPTPLYSAPPKLPGTCKRKFTTEEDERLTLIVNQLGESNWKLVSAHMGDRDCRQCRERWKNYLAPTVCKDPWTPEEDRLLEEKYAELGSQWSLLARFFPSRTDVNLKNRWVVLAGRTAVAPRVRRRGKSRGAPDPPLFEPQPPSDDWGDAGLSRFCDDAEIYDGAFEAAFGL
jgi:hypothetical protein